MVGSCPNLWRLKSHTYTQKTTPVQSLVNHWWYQCFWHRVPTVPMPMRRLKTASGTLDKLELRGSLHTRWSLRWSRPNDFSSCSQPPALETVISNEVCFFGNLETSETQESIETSHRTKTVVKHVCLLFYPFWRWLFRNFSGSVGDPRRSKKVMCSSH